MKLLTTQSATADPLHFEGRQNSSEFHRKRPRSGPITPMEIETDLKSLLTDVYGFSDATNGLSDQEKDSWCLLRLTLLDEIATDIAALEPHQQEYFATPAGTADAKISEARKLL